MSFVSIQNLRRKSCVKRKIKNIMDNKSNKFFFLFSSYYDCNFLSNITSKWKGKRERESKKKSTESQANRIIILFDRMLNKKLSRKPIKMRFFPTFMDETRWHSKNNRILRMHLYTVRFQIYWTVSAKRSLSRLGNRSIIRDCRVEMLTTICRWTAMHSKFELK